jgi:uncharacterized protein
VRPGRPAGRHRARPVAGLGRVSKPAPSRPGPPAGLSLVKRPGPTGGGPAAGLSPAARRVIVGATGVAAAALLRASFTATPGSRRFYLLTGTMAATWTAGALTAGPVFWHRPSRPPRPSPSPGLGPLRPADAPALVLLPVATGAATFAVFYAAAHAVRRNPLVGRIIASVFHYADAGSTPLVVLIAATSGVAEELYFRGALWSGPRPLRETTLAYAASTAATGNPALVLAGLITSVIFGWQRAATGGVLAPALTHLTWSVLMLRYLPPLFRDQLPAQAVKIGGPAR